MAQTRLLIVPSDFVAWPGLIDQLRAVETVRVVGVTRSWSEALRVGEISRPNVVLAAEPCGDEPVLQPLRQMRRILPNATFVILTTSFDPDHLLMLAEVGVSGYLRWDGLTSYDTLPHLAIAMNGKTVVLHNDIAEAYVNAMRTRFCLIAEPPTISEREGRILSMMGRGAWSHETFPISLVALRRGHRACHGCAAGHAKAALDWSFTSANYAVAPDRGDLGRYDCEPDECRACGGPHGSHVLDC